MKFTKRGQVTIGIVVWCAILCTVCWTVGFLFGEQHGQRDYSGDVATLERANAMLNAQVCSPSIPDGPTEYKHGCPDGAASPDER